MRQFSSKANRSRLRPAHATFQVQSLLSDEEQKGIMTSVKATEVVGRRADTAGLRSAIYTGRAEGTTSGDVE
jgi:hypothetical protein